MRRLSLDILTVMGMEPLPYIKLARDLGCDHIGMQVAPVTTIPELYSDWSLRDNPQLVRDIRAALSDYGLSVHLGEGFLLQDDTDVRDFAPDLALLAEVGARSASICSFDADRNRAFDALAVFAEMAREAGLSATLEFAPALGIADLPTAVDAVGYAAVPDFGIVIDAMHFFRSGAIVDDLVRLDPALISYVQLCDVPQASSLDYVTEACFERRGPGEGNLPLKKLVASLPSDIVVGLETPMRARILSGEDPALVLAPAVAAARRLLHT